MSLSIDPFISIHFQDQTESFGPDDAAEVIIEGERSQVAGAEAFAVARECYTEKLTHEEQRARAAQPNVVRITSMVREDQVAVLVRLRSPDWKVDVPGFTRNSQLGDVVAGQATQEAIKILAKDRNVIAIEASRPVAEDGDCIHSIPHVKATLVHAPPIKETGSEALVGIIDSGIDVLHWAFQVRDANGEFIRSRIIGIWDQRSSMPVTPRSATSAGNTAGADYPQDYGRYHSAADIDGYVRSGTVPGDLGRNDYPQDGHGTHVTSIAAGSKFKSAGSYDSKDDQLDFPGGVAPEADIVVVIPKLTAAPGDPASLGYSVSHVDALAFIKETARAAEKPVAVNVSLGMNAGAHDGTSLLELAFDQFSGGGREPGLVIVKSAGNEQTHGGHAEAVVTTGATASIGWSSNSRPRGRDYLEFWFRSADDLDFELWYAPPTSGVLTPVVAVTRATPMASHPLPGGLGVCYLVLERLHHDNGDSRLIVLVRMNQNKALQAAGQWELRITGKSVLTGGGQVHGWVERDNARALRFTTGAVPGKVVSIPGTARTVISVGACDVSTPPNVQSFSSQGPGRDGREKPEVAAPGHDILAAQAGTTVGLVAMPGTSMAAPHVTGAVALLLSHRQKQIQEEIKKGVPLLARKRMLNAAQIRAGLSQCSPHFTGRWDPGLGYGCLDVERLFQIFF
ncbi:Subtilase family protein [Prosthecobacter debontii]|uniref:Subtilase family protein n=1 Tax=Prosthecobacter debontii TaxID=48467 RepID=A0A1T4XZW1_9BACT|nr:S8 family serine peptidase [Prosthecobacter debontii]SKA94591.1 Subtilase family protein [Prosthecobacter debontii]